MSDISESIWKQDKFGEWKLYFNIDEEISFFPEKNKEVQKTENEINLSDKNLTLGILVMTPKGIGRLLKNVDGVSHIKFNQDNKDYEFPSKQISNCFYCFITFILKGNLDIIRLKLKVDGKISDIIDETNQIKMPVLDKIEESMQAKRIPSIPKELDLQILVLEEMVNC